MTIHNAISVEQGCCTMYIFKLSTEDLLSNYIISNYDSVRETGYQRPPVESHYKKIARYLAAAGSGQILPMSIIAAATREDISYQGNELTIEGRLRIVDGQHRIKAIEYLRDGKNPKYNDKYKELANDYEFPVILLTADETDSALEMDTFININSKGKRVSINLAKELCEKKMQADLTKHEIGLNSDTYENLATQVVKRLAHDKASLWYERIQMGDELGFQKPVSVGTADLTKRAVERLWRTVQGRWPECFEEPKQYNLLKGLGVSVIHRLFESCIGEIRSSDPEKVLEDAQEAFERYLDRTDVEAEEWMVGGIFTGFSSEQGYGIIMNIIVKKYQGAVYAIFNHAGCRTRRRPGSGSSI